MRIPNSAEQIIDEGKCNFMLCALWIYSKYNVLAQKIEQIVRKKYKKADISTSLCGNWRNFCYKDVVFSRKNIIFAEYFVKSINSSSASSTCKE